MEFAAQSQKMWHLYNDFCKYWVVSNACYRIFEPKGGLKSYLHYTLLYLSSFYTMNQFFRILEVTTCAKFYLTKGRE